MDLATTANCGKDPEMRGTPADRSSSLLYLGRLSDASAACIHLTNAGEAYGLIVSIQHCHALRSTAYTGFSKDFTFGNFICFPRLTVHVASMNPIDNDREKKPRF